MVEAIIIAGAVVSVGALAILAGLGLHDAYGGELTCLYPVRHAMPRQHPSERETELTVNPFAGEG